ncbi:MAG: carboxypeptidase-like regulatory domain-containing protein, partial [Odoribacter sp.]|nr:carboxypeptidase-like regulatory domain-containing protein [Odoribacter sp.]
MMKILCFLMCVWLVQVKAEAYGQSQLVTLSLKDCNAEEFLQVMKEQTGIRFMYRSEYVSGMPRFNVEANGQRVDEVLESVFGAYGIRCVFDDGVVMLEKQQAQPVKREVKGVVVDAGGMSLPGVTILVKGTTMGVSTDVDGQFVFSTTGTEPVTLIFSCVGMKTKEVVWDKQAELKIVMEEEVSEIDEVVVTGIFKKAKESYTGSVSTISKEDLQIHRGQNLLQTLKNADASLNFAVNNVAGSNPNALPQVNIRGNSSLPMSVQEYNESASNAVNTPLIIMDGFEISLEKLMDYNDDEIESINILKDAAATAIYGSRGSNGVIVVVTKQPEAGKLRVNAEVGIDLE